MARNYVLPKFCRSLGLATLVAQLRVCYLASICATSANIVLYFMRELLTKHRVPSGWKYSNSLRILLEMMIQRDFGCAKTVVTVALLH